MKMVFCSINFFLPEAQMVNLKKIITKAIHYLFWKKQSFLKEYFTKKFRTRVLSLSLMATIVKYLTHYALLLPSPPKNKRVPFAVCTLHHQETVSFLGTCTLPNFPLKRCRGKTDRDRARTRDSFPSLQCHQTRTLEIYNGFCKPLLHKPLIYRAFPSTSLNQLQAVTKKQNTLWM